MVHVYGFLILHKLWVSIDICNGKNLLWCYLVVSSYNYEMSEYYCSSYCSKHVIKVNNYANKFATYISIIHAISQNFI